jgi:hypothetical protein
VSQFFDSNPGDRSPNGPKRGGWSTELPRTWRTALGLPARDPTEEPEGEAPTDDGAPSLGVAAGEEPRI